MYQDIKTNHRGLHAYNSSLDTESLDTRYEDVFVLIWLCYDERKTVHVVCWFCEEHCGSHAGAIDTIPCTYIMVYTQTDNFWAQPQEFFC